MHLDAKTIIAIIVLAGGFFLLGIYALRGTTPDAVMVAVVAPLMGGAVGYFFGRVNGAAEAGVLQLVNDRRANVTQLPVQVVPAPPPVP